MTRSAAVRLGRRALRIFPIVAVVVLGVIFRDEVASAGRRLLTLHPIVFLVFPLYAGWNFIAAYAWRALMVGAAPGQTPPTAWRLSILRLQSQAINMAVPFAAGVGGGAVRIGFTREIGLAPAAAAALLDDVAGGVAGLAFVALALAFVPGTLFHIPATELAIGCGAGAIVLWVAVVWLAPTLAARLDPAKPLGNALRVLAHNRHGLAPAFAAAVGWHVIERVISVGEIWIAFIALRAGAGFADAMTVQAASVAVSLLLFFIPGQPGAAEATIAAACASIGLDPATGLAVAFIRRARQLLVTGAGLLSLSFSSKTVTS